jgi:pyruvate dehydrogenase E1 component beta subunit
MSVITYPEALRQALVEEMERDESVFVMGEEVGLPGGAHQITKGLMERFGEKRCFDTPISEAGFIGMGVAAAMCGIRPVIEVMTWSFSLPAMDMIVNHMAKMRFMSGGQFKVPMVIRGPGGQGNQLSAQHSQSLEAMFAHVPGLYVVCPATPADAKGLLKTSIRDDNPICFIEHAGLYHSKGEVPDGEHLVPLGQALVRRAGEDCSVITYSRSVLTALRAAEALEEDGISVEVVDLRTLNPLDMNTVIQSVQRTSRAVVVTEDHFSAGMSGDLAARITETCFDYLDAPVERVAGADVPMPFARNIELLSVPDVNAIAEGVKRCVARQVGPVTSPTIGTNGHGAAHMPLGAGMPRYQGSRPD